MTKTKGTTKKSETASSAAPLSTIDVRDDARDEADRHEVQEWFDRWADQLGMRLPEFFGNRLPEFWGASREMGGVIRIEETVTDDGITIRGELPGIDPDTDVEITVENGRLNISAERRQHTEQDEDGGFRTEFRYGSYRRSCSLPAGTKAEDITATYDDGILEITIPVGEEPTESSKIPVARSK